MGTAKFGNCDNYQPITLDQLSPRPIAEEVDGDLLESMARVGGEDMGRFDYTSRRERRIKKEEVVEDSEPIVDFGAIEEDFTPTKIYRSLKKRIGNIPDDKCKALAEAIYKDCKGK